MQASTIRLPQTLTGRPARQKASQQSWRSFGLVAMVTVVALTLVAWTLLTYTIQRPGPNVGSGIHPQAPTSAPKLSCAMQDQGTNLPTGSNIEHSLSLSPLGEITTTAWNVKTFDVHTCKQVISPTSGQATDADWSPDGKKLLAVWADAKIFDLEGHVLVMHSVNPANLGVAATGTALLASQSGGGNAFRDSTWSPDGKRIASVYVLGASITYGVEVWSATTGAHLLTLACPNDMAYGIRNVTWSADGKYIAAIAPAGSINTICIWSASSGSLVDSIQSSAVQVSFSADGHRLVYTQSGQIRIYDLATRTIVHTFALSRNQGQVVWSPNGKYLAVSGTQRVYLLNASTGAVVKTYTITEGSRVEHLAWSADSDIVAAQSTNPNVPTAYLSLWHVE